VVIWQFVSTKKRVGWAVHSTIVASANIACLDYKQGESFESFVERRCGSAEPA
jgi:hypothetical protein